MIFVHWKSTRYLQESKMIVVTVRNPWLSISQTHKQNGGLQKSIWRCCMLVWKRWSSRCGKARAVPVLANRVWWSTRLQCALCFKQFAQSRLKTRIEFLLRHQQNASSLYPRNLDQNNSLCLHWRSSWWVFSFPFFLKSFFSSSLSIFSPYPNY